MNRAQQRAVSIASRICSSLFIRVGESEIEVSDRIKKQLKSSGARPAFRILVASGRRAAIPHGYATRKKIRKGELVVIDFGALYNGYRSDISRTYVAGKPGARQKKLMQIVREAQKRAIAAVRGGIACNEVDKVARGYIEKKGYGACFVHSTGHGIGKKVHQAPKISKRNRRKLKAGTVITVEPGIYIKGWGGVRIEDMVLVTKRGCRILTKG